jgi:hypothetical protein
MRAWLVMASGLVAILAIGSTALAALAWPGRDRSELRRRSCPAPRSFVPDGTALLGHARSALAPLLCWQSRAAPMPPLPLPL